MNERINELAEQAVDFAEQIPYFHGVENGLTWEEAFQQAFSLKFAELIVRECAEVCKKQSFHYAEHNNNGSAASAADVCRILIKQHFGVEE